MARYPKTIYFINGEHPTQDDFSEAESIGPGVVFRNARRIVPGAPLENCDAVAGAVPPDYARVYNVAAGENNPNILVRPNPTVTATSGGPDDYRPGTVHDGLAHESGYGSQFSGDPYAERAAARALDQRQGKPVYEKNPQREAEVGDVQPAYGLNLQRAASPAMGAWPTTGQPGEANIHADMAPQVAKDVAEETADLFADAAQRRAEGDEKRQDYEAQEFASQQEAIRPWALPQPEEAKKQTKKSKKQDENPS